MFMHCINLSIIDLSYLNFENVISMNGTFYLNSILKNIIFPKSYKINWFMIMQLFLIVLI